MGRQIIILDEIDKFLKNILIAKIFFLRAVMVRLSFSSIA